MKLSDLEFTVEDCDAVNIHVGTSTELFISLKQANRLLRARLDKAPVVYAEKEKETWSEYGWKWELPGGKTEDRTAFTARLVCVEELKK